MTSENFDQKMEKRLKKEQESIQDSLESFAIKDKELKGDWDSSFPKINEANLEESADAVEQYGNALPVEFSLEKRLQDIKLALEKIKNGKYGICEICKKPISHNRLEVFPEAKTCGNCLNKE